MRPSELYGISSDVEAWAFDRAVTYFGMEVEADLESIESKNAKVAKQKREQRLQQWLAGGAETVAKGVFRDPAARGPVRRA